MFMVIPVVVIVGFSLLLMYLRRDSGSDAVMMNWPRNWWKRHPVEDKVEKLAMKLGCSKEEVLHRALMLVDLAAEEGTHIAVLDRKQHVRLILSSLQDDDQK